MQLTWEKNVLKNPNIKLIGIGDWAKSNNPKEQLKTLGLGSCVALYALNPRKHFAIMAHVVLPDSSIDKEKAEIKPGYFADTAVDLLIREAVGNDRGKDFHALEWFIIGGANIVSKEEECVFNIGKRNGLSIKKKLFLSGIAVQDEVLGGNISRTTWVEVASGEIFVQTPGQKPECVFKGTTVWVSRRCWW